MTINVEETDDDVIITIADNGCGIPAEHLPKIKQKFYKANQTVRGSGIGLAVADEIVKLHNGRLDIDSVENVGTTVTISIPTIKPELESQNDEDDADDDNEITS